MPTRAGPSNTLLEVEITMKRQDFRFAHRLRVRWVEVDMQQIVFNGHYLMYFDTAVTDYWRALAMPYAATMQQLGGDLYVKKASVEYHASAEMDDFLDVCMRCERVGNSSMTFVGAIFRGDELLIKEDDLLKTRDRFFIGPHDHRQRQQQLRRRGDQIGAVLDHERGGIVFGQLLRLRIDAGDDADPRPARPDDAGHRGDD